MEQTLILPVSGGLLINQMAIFVKLHQKGYIPNIIMSASGGAVVAQIVCVIGIDQPHDIFLDKVKSLLSNINADNVFRTHPLSPSLFDIIFRKYGIPWKYIPGIPFKGFLGFDFDQLPELWIMGYSVEDYTSTEIIRNGKYDKNDRPIVWTNKSDPIMWPNSKVLIDAFNNPEELEQVVRGSSTIPGYNEPYVINGLHIIDGCVAGASPLEYFVGNYRERVPLNIIYVSSIDKNIQWNTISATNPFFGTANKVMSNLIGSDVEIIERLVDKLSNGKYSIEEGSLDDLSLNNNYNGSAIFIYPLYPVEFNMFEVRVNTLNKIFDKALKLTFWYKRWYY